MRGHCARCDRTHRVRHTRGSRLADHPCPGCGGERGGVTADRAQARYRCPITDDVVTDGATGTPLEGPHRLVWLPGSELTEPDRWDAAKLARVAGRLLGTGCVVRWSYDPDPGYEREPGRYGRLVLVPVPPDEAGDPAGWLVNQQLRYRACAGCGAKVADEPERRVEREWAPRHRSVRRGSGRRSHRVDTDPGPHPAGTLACQDCDPRVAEPAGVLRLA